IGGVLEPAGLDKSGGAISPAYYKDPADPQYAHEPAMEEWVAFMKKYYPDGNLADSFNVYGYLVAQTLVQTLKQCGNDLSRENVMREAAKLDMKLPLLLDGINIKTGPKDFRPIKQMRLEKFDGKRWVLFGD